VEKNLPGRKEVNRVWEGRSNTRGDFEGTANSSATYDIFLGRREGNFEREKEILR